MKKFLSIMLAVLMLVGLFTVSVFAEDNGAYDATNVTKPADKPGSVGAGVASLNDSVSADVQISIKGKTVNTYAVDIIFGALQFTYGADSTWNPQTHTYDVAANSSWSPATADADKIIIENHSDVAIAYTLATENMVSAYGNLTIGFDVTNGTLDSYLTNNSVDSDVITVSVSGTPTGLPTGVYKTLGTVTVTVEPATTTP